MSKKTLAFLASKVEFWTQSDEQNVGRKNLF